MCVCVCVCVYMYICMYLYKYVCIHVCEYACKYVVSLLSVIDYCHMLIFSASCPVQTGAFSPLPSDLRPLSDHYGCADCFSYLPPFLCSLSIIIVNSCSPWSPSLSSLSFLSFFLPSSALSQLAAPPSEIFIVLLRKCLSLSLFFLVCNWQPRLSSAHPMSQSRTRRGTVLSAIAICDLDGKVLEYIYIYIYIYISCRLIEGHRC